MKYAMQIEKGAIRKYITPAEKKRNKKLHVKRLRRTPVSEIPLSNRYKGHIV